MSDGLLRMVPAETSTDEANKRVGLEKYSRPILQDQDRDCKYQDQDKDLSSQDQDRIKPVWSALKTKTAVSRTTSLTDYPKFISYAKFEHFVIIHFYVRQLC